MLTARCQMSEIQMDHVPVKRPQQQVGAACSSPQPFSSVPVPPHLRPRPARVPLSENRAHARAALYLTLEPSRPTGASPSIPHRCRRAPRLYSELGVRRPFNLLDNPWGCKRGSQRC